MTTLADIDRLRAIAVELDEIAIRSAQCIAQEFDRDDLMREATDRIGWAAGEARKGATVWSWAIQETGGESDGQD